MKRVLYALIGVGVLCFMIGNDIAFAQTSDEADLIVRRAKIVLEEMMRSQDSAPAIELIRDSAGIIIIPGFFKAGFFAGAAYGRGVMLARRDGTWSAPAFVYIGAGSIGIQFGLQMTDLLLVVMGERTMHALLQSNFKLGADAAIAAGPLGAQVAAASDIRFRGGIFSYSRARGLFAGISLEGARMGTVLGLNRAFYETTADPRQILFGEVDIPHSATELIRELEQIQ